jgi:hypothetical protein
MWEIQGLNSWAFELFLRRGFEMHQCSGESGGRWRKEVRRRETFRRDSIPAMTFLDFNNLFYARITNSPISMHTPNVVRVLHHGPGKVSAAHRSGLRRLSRLAPQMLWN